MRVINKKFIIALALSVCIATSLFVALQFVRALSGITVFVSPAETTAVVYTDFTVQIWIENMYSTPIEEYDIVMNYDSTKMTPISAVDGGYLMPPIEFNYDLGMGDQVWAWAFTLDGGQTETGGILVAFTFHCDAPGDSDLTLSVILFGEGGVYIDPDYVVGGMVHQKFLWEPTVLQDIVELPYTYQLVDLPFVPPDQLEGYFEIKTELEAKGYTFDIDSGGSKYWVESFFDVYFDPGSDPFEGMVASWWSANTLEDGTRACLLSAEMADGTGMAMGFVTNLLPPDQIPEIDPYIIYNAEPYFFIDFYWWAWTPIGKVVHFYYWWHDSHNHPNWFWGPYWWWRSYVKSYYYPYTDVPYWRPWWGWWWHWLYGRHWYWWSSYFPYSQ